MTTELQVARELARAAGGAVMERYGDKESAKKAGGSPVTPADRAADSLIRRGLSEAFPADVILSEETPDTAERLSRRRIWIVDPLDGTKEYLAGNGEFAVMIGLVQDDRPVLGVVYIPARGVMYAAVDGQGVIVERPDSPPERLRITHTATPLRMIGSRSHREGVVEEIRTRIGAGPVTPCGSVGLKCAKIAEGSFDLYIHPAPYLMEWDTCAPEVIVREAGGWVFDCNGEPLSYNKPRPNQPHGIVACGPGVDVSLRDLIREAYRGSRASD